MKGGREGGGRERIKRRKRNEGKEKRWRETEKSEIVSEHKEYLICWEIHVPQ